MSIKEQTDKTLVEQFYPNPKMVAIDFLKKQIVKTFLEDCGFRDFFDS